MTGTISIKAKPSCNNTKKLHTTQDWATYTYVDKCPLCGATDCLKANPKGVSEGEITCGKCDADYCGACGQEKLTSPRGWLTSSDSSSSDSDSSSSSVSYSTDLTQIVYEDPWTSRSDWSETLVDGLRDVNVSEDSSDLSHEITFTLLYSSDLFSQLAKYRRCTFLMYRRGETQYTLEGFINQVSRVQENNQPLIKVTITGYTSYLEQQVAFSATEKKSVLIEKVLNMAGMKANLDLTGLTDDEYTLETVGSSSSGDDSSSTSSGSDTEKRAEIFEKAATWKYGGASYQDPEEAYNWTEAHKCGDCFCASASLYYQFKTFTSYGVRIVWCHSSSARSGTHRTIQLKENGSWVDPPEYDNMTTNLHVIKSATKYQYGSYVRE